MSSPAIIGGALAMTTSDKGQLRFPALPPGSYTLNVERPGFATYREDDIQIGAGATLERTIVLTIIGRSETVVVEGTGSRIEARGAGFRSRTGSEDLRTIPARRSSMFDAIRSAPGISPTSPSGASSVTATTVSAFGSGTNENQLLIDGTNFTCPCNGVARAEPGVDFIQEVQIQSAGASVEFGNVQGAVIYCDACGEFGHTSMTTDENGAYDFGRDGIWSDDRGVTALVVFKEGYFIPGGSLGPSKWTLQHVRANGDTRFDFQMVRLQ